MFKTPLGKINWLPISRVAEQWGPEIGLDPADIERELRIAYFKKVHDLPWDVPIEVSPDTIDLPSPDTLINREFVRNLHSRDLWKLPTFWFKKETGRSFVGRPSIRNALVQELEKRAEQGELEETLAEQSRQMEEWGREHYPNEQTPVGKAMQNALRRDYNRFKAARKMTEE